MIDLITDTSTREVTIVNHDIKVFRSWCCLSFLFSPKVKKLRRLEENDEFDKLASLLPIKDADKLDRSSVLKLILAYLSLRKNTKPGKTKIPN